MEFVVTAHALKIKLFGLYLHAGRHGGYLACGPQAGTLAGAGGLRFKYQQKTPPMHNHELQTRGSP
jgi:hypothetical protein